MRKAAFAGLFACACVFAYSPSANAETFELFNSEQRYESSVTENVLSLVDPMEEPTPHKENTVEKVKPKVVKHTVVEGESLDSIARLYDTTWKKLYNKNESINNPDLIKAGETLTIPKKDEKLKERKLPEVQAEQDAPDAADSSEPATASRPATEAQVATRPAARQTAPAPAVRGSSSGNTYTPGQCTWHVKNLRGSSLPNGLGNADQWYYRAQAMGLATGTTPRVGAAAVRKVGNHAAYVTAVHSNGTITVSEMNYNWTPYATRTAVKPASDFFYIY